MSFADDFAFEKGSLISQTRTVISDREAKNLGIIGPGRVEMVKLAWNYF